jgi:uncharacterized membrane protein SirB2
MSKIRSHFTLKFQPLTNDILLLFCSIKLFLSSSYSPFLQQYTFNEFSFYNESLISTSSDIRYFTFMKMMFNINFIFQLNDEWLKISQKKKKKTKNFKFPWISVDIENCLQLF